MTFLSLLTFKLSLMLYNLSSLLRVAISSFIFIFCSYLICTHVPRNEASSIKTKENISSFLRRIFFLFTSSQAFDSKHVQDIQFKDVTFCKNNKVHYISKKGLVCLRKTFKAYKITCMFYGSKIVTVDVESSQHNKANQGKLQQMS